MIRCRIALLAVTAAAALLPGKACAQFNNPSFGQSSINPQYGGYGPQFQPSLSPYLGILSGNPAVGYYGQTRGVIPSFRQGYLNNQFNASLFDLQRRQAQGTQPGEEISLLPGTGHPTAFGFYAPYYNLNPAQRIPPQLTPQTSTGARRSSKQ